MMRFESEQVKTDFEAAFGMKLEDITPQMARFLVCFSKHVRGRCRSNAALNNYLKRSFPELLFTEVTKEYKDRITGATKTFQTLRITSKHKPSLPAADEGNNDGESE